jgi:hypothetical protein
MRFCDVLELDADGLLAHSGRVADDDIEATGSQHLGGEDLLPRLKAQAVSVDDVLEHGQLIAGLQGAQQQNESVRKRSQDLSLDLNHPGANEV